MKQILKKIITKNKIIFDVLGIILFCLSACILKIYKLIGVKNSRYSTKLIKVREKKGRFSRGKGITMYNFYIMYGKPARRPPVP